MNFLRQLVQQLADVWQRQSRAAQFAYGGLLGMLVLLIGGVGYWASAPDYRVLFSGLSLEDGGAITAKLDSLQVPYRMSSDSTTVLVPALQVAKLRMDLALAGIPGQPGKGFELFEDSRIGMTPFDQNVNYLRAIQGELARTIMQLEPVAHARVHIVQPDPSPFVREQKPVTASVVIKPKPNFTLARKEASAIVALVAGSVKGLAADHVTVLDTRGRILSEQQDPSGSSLSNQQLTYQRDVEAYLAQKAQEILSQPASGGHAVVRVSASINFKRVKETSETFNPEGRALAKESVKNLKQTSGAGGQRGIAGAASNLPNAVQSVRIEGGGDGNRQEEDIESEFLVSKTQRLSEEMAGAIERLTVAVMWIPPETKNVGEGDPAAALAAPEVEKLVKQAVGFVDGRDQIQVSVAKAPEDTSVSTVEAALTDQINWQNYATVARNVSLGIAAIVAMMLSWMIVARLLPKPEQQRTANLVRLREQYAPVLTEDPELIAQAIKSWLEAT